jgi:hypothetical protein
MSKDNKDTLVPHTHTGINPDTGNAETVTYYIDPALLQTGSIPDDIGTAGEHMTEEHFQSISGEGDTEKPTE